MFLFQLRNELWKLFGKKRTYIGFAIFLLGQNFIILLYRFGDAPKRAMRRMMELNGFDAKQYITSLTVTSIMVVAMAYTLMPMFAALIGGDQVAKEAEDGTLRMILSRPISRFRLLFLKWLAGAIFSLVLVMSLGALGLLFCSMWFPWGNLFCWEPLLPFGAYGAAEGFVRYFGAHLCMFPAACTMMTLAFMFSCFNMKPAAAMVLALSIMLICQIMQNEPLFLEYKTWFVTYDMAIWREIFAQRIPWWKVGESYSCLFGYNLTFLVIGFTAFQMRDIKS